MRRIVWIAAVGLACGGSDPTAVDWRNGTAYKLETINGQPVPAVYIVGDYTSWEVVADTIVLRPDATGTQVFVSRPVYPNVPPGDPVRVVRDFTYTFAAGVLAITLPCDDALLQANSCVAPPHYRGSLTSEGITFDIALTYPTPARFARIFD